MDKQQREYAGKVWQTISQSPQFKGADYETKKRIRADWQAEHVEPFQAGGREKQAATPARVDLGAEPATMVPTATRQQQPNVYRAPARLKPQAPQSRRDLTAYPPPPAITGNAGNMFLSAYSKLAAPTAMRAAGRDPLPMGTVRELDSPTAEALTSAPAMAENLTANIALDQVPGLGPALSQAISQPLLNAPRYAEAGLTPEQMQRFMFTDAMSGAVMPTFNRLFPGGTIGKTLMAEATQAGAQAGADMIGKGIDPTAESVLMNFGLGLGLRGASGGLRPEIQQAKQLSRRALDAVSQPIPLGDLESQRGSIRLPFGREGGDPQGRGSTGQPQPPGRPPADQQHAQPQPWQVPLSEFGANRPQPSSASEAPTIESLRQSLPQVESGFTDGPVQRAIMEPAKGPPGVSIEEGHFAGTPQPNTRNVVYRDQSGDAVGILTILLDEGGRPNILQVAVDPAHQGKGIASALYAKAKDAFPDIEQASGRGGYTEGGAALAHARSVRQALAEGRAVPDSVMADYPHFAAQAAGGGAPPPNVPPVAAPAPAPPPPPLPPASTAAPAAPAPPPGQPGSAPSGMVGPEAGRAKPTPEMRRVYGPDVQNVAPGSEAAKALADVANVMDDRPRPAADPAAVAEARKKVDKGDYFNWRRSGLSGQTQDAMANRIAEVVAENGWNPKQRVGFDQIRQEAAQVSPELLQHLAQPKAGETLNPAVRLAARENLQALSVKVDQMQTDLNAQRSGMTADEIRDAEGQIGMMNRDAKRLLDVLIPTRSQDGRNLAYHAITAKNNFDVDYWSSRAARAAGVQSLPDADVTKVRDLTLRGQRAQAAGDAAGADAARLDLARYLAKLEKSTALETVSAVIKAGLLTSPKTHLRNIGGNAAFQLAEEAARLPAALFDMAMSFGGGRRTISGPSIKSLGRAAQDGATKGWREAGQIMRDGATEDALKRFELPRELNSGHKWLDAYTNFVFRSLGAEDRLFRSAATRRSLDDQALVVAMNEAKAGTIPRNQIRQRAAALAAAPDDAMMVNAIAAADVATFQNDNAASQAWGSAMRTLKQRGNTGAKFVAETAVATFVKTPTNVVARMLDYMGVGAPKVAIAVAKRLMGKLTPEEQRAASQAFGRGLVGWGMIMLGRAAYRSGQATGLTTEEESGMRGANQLADRPEGAVRVGNRWLQLTGVAPLGGLFVLGATLEQEGSQKSADPLKPFVNSAAAATQVVMQNPFAQGAQNVLGAVKDPLGAGSRWVTGLPSMAVPTAVSDVAQAFDGSQRQGFSKSANHAVNVARQVMAKIPGARNLLPEKTDPFGRPLPTNRAAAFDPFNSRPATEQTDPVAAAIIRTQTDVRPPKAYADLPNAEGEKQRTNLTIDEQNETRRRFGELAKPAIEAMIASGEWQGLTPAQQQDALDKILSNAMRQVNAETKARFQPAQ